MIVGIGTDVIEIARVQQILDGSTGNRFIEKVLTVSERELLIRRKPNHEEFLAGRFAAKEAVVKAFGCGIGRQAGFHDMEILPDDLGKPICCISDAAKQRLHFSPQHVIHISISHSKTVATATAIVEKQD